MPSEKPVAHAGTEDAERLLVTAAQKDPARFGHIYELYFERVYAYIVRRVADRDVAEDLTADVFHKALASLPSFEWRGVPFGAWLIRIAANAVVDQCKRASREAPGGEEASEPWSAPDFDVVENRARLYRLVNELPANQRLVIQQRFVEEKSIRDIARHLGRTEGAVKQLQFRAIESLRAQMEGGDA